jgi:hypothetical protein
MRSRRAGSERKCTVSDACSTSSVWLKGIPSGVRVITSSFG